MPVIWGLPRALIVDVASLTQTHRPSTVHRSVQVNYRLTLSNDAALILPDSRLLQWHCDMAKGELLVLCV